MFNNNKNAQMEIVGLAFIVILVSLVLLFALQYSFKETPKTVQKTKEKIIAENFISAMLKTNTQCHERKMGELIQDCALVRTINCDGKTTCEYAKTTIGQLLQNTLKKWNKQYRFVIDGAENLNQIKFESSPSACKGQKQAVVAPFTITAGFDVTIKLDIC